MLTITCDGNAAAARVAYAFSEVAAIYPITPSTPMAEACDEWAAKGRQNLFGQTLRIVEMQSEAGAAGAVHGSLSAGALTTTFTASQGLLLMLPAMCKISGELLPTVFHVSARALSYHALSIFGDHSDVMAARFTGFCMLCSNSVQAAHDLAVVAHLASLKSSVPFLHFFDGFRTSHEVQKIEVLEDGELRPLLPEKAIDHFRCRAMSPDHPHQQGTAQNPDLYFQGREAGNPFYSAVTGIVQQCMDEVAAVTGRPYRLFDYEGAEDAQEVIVVMGSAGETCAETARRLNRQGRRTGVVHVRLYRPFDGKALVDALPRTVRRIAVLDRVKESGSLGEPLYLDVVAALDRHGRTDVITVGGRYGLGSKEFAPMHAKAVFDMLRDGPKHNFTVGIVDDLTDTSLPASAYFNAEQPDTVRCKFFGLGSDGTVGANKNAVRIIAGQEGMHAQAHFAYDSKKSGGLTVSHLRFGRSPIRSPYLIHQADFIACHNPAFLHTVDVADGLREGGTFLLNCPWGMETPASLPDGVKRKLGQARAKLYVIDASALAQRAGLGRRINTVMQSAFFRLSGVLPWEEALALMQDAVRSTYGKKGDEVVAQNLNALSLAADGLLEVPVSPEWAELPEAPVPAEHTYLNQFIQPVLMQKGDGLPVSMVDARGHVPTGTSKYEKRGVATHVSHWLIDRCIQCGRCTMVCPHGCIRAFYPEEGAELPEGFEVKRATGKEFTGRSYRVQVSPMDCTGCGNCVDACPVKGKALDMRPAMEQLPQQALWDFAVQLPQMEDVPVASVKAAQGRPAYFEFSGACAGCGETPYIGLLTRLFGRRMLIANATGCSSIYAGSAPTCPYTKDPSGHGPAWGSSLFENNAEFGLGMHLALRQRTDKRALSAEKPSVWCIGGDGWAYDIGFGGLDHVLASGEDVNLLVLDTEVYSNTGGQASKATPAGAAARFASGGKTHAKKDLGRMALTYPDVYVAQVNMGADPQQLITALNEADAWPGPSLVIAYAPCIAHGIDMGLTQSIMKAATDCGMWPLYRRHPERAAIDLDRCPLPEDGAFRAFLMRQGRFATLARQDPDRAEDLFARCREDASRRTALLHRLAKTES